MGVSQERGATRDGEDVEGAVEQRPCGAAGACLDTHVSRVLELLEEQTQDILGPCGDDAAEGVRTGMGGQGVPVVGEAHDAGSVVQLVVQVAMALAMVLGEGLQAGEGRRGRGRGLGTGVGVGMGMGMGVVGCRRRHGVPGG